MSAGSAGTPLWQKIGISDGARVAPLNLPKHAAKLLKGAPHHEHVETDADIVWLFVASASEFNNQFAGARQCMKTGGMLWVSAPRLTGDLTTDLTDAYVREAALAIGLVDVKVCLVDDDWGAIKFVLRRELH